MERRSPNAFLVKSTETGRFWRLILARHEPALKMTALSVRYGAIRALDDVDVALCRREAIGILGANGAGKTTLLNTLSGFLRPAKGTIELDGERIDACAPHVIVRRGLLHVSQGRDLFGTLSVLDNLRLGAIARGKSRFDQNLERVFASFPRLKERRRQQANTLSGGEQQMLAIGRALMAEPKILLLDEPSAGLSPLFIQEIGAMMMALRQTSDIAIVLVEQNIGFAAQVTDRFVMLRAGKVAARGESSELRATAEEIVRKYYL
jgi:branched-chain amino acid transport system ATP-binding protein